ncbi:hypothetical protein M441DRAFT_326905 [Trichoderma asperellum CBS 433.97]|uniref:Uncharacterized protein n=1 Tax=Trichoderma asperellum (strain ATCC 204424 / CBS 433.97 / NBRC 101777) TaxID=1042311 RepID=A0A2T3ZM37_TRIA4|nr:hypothetical protein M441DRAFT_326905 [Trichoderma asperellum CBS 433.97]PTB45870.1 hypothetical protein M441DRAFT_326905 [Trichoderma asperellum CBS 433.97]
MGAIEAKVYKGNTALAAKRGVFVYSTFYFTTFTLFLHLLVHHTFIWNIPPFFISFFLHTISLGFHFRAKYLDQIMLGFLIDGVASLPIFSRLRKATQRERERERERQRATWAFFPKFFLFPRVYESLDMDIGAWSTFGTIYNYFIILLPTLHKYDMGSFSGYMTLIPIVVNRNT